MEVNGKIITCDQEWSHEELYGVAYDECIFACRKLNFLLDTKDLDKPNILMELIMDELDKDMNLVDYYNRMYDNKDTEDTSDDVFNNWDNWIKSRIQLTLLTHKYKGYINR